MANPLRGDVAVNVPATSPNRGVPLSHDGVTYNLRFTTNALCELEEKLGESVMQVASRMQNVENIRVATMRAMFWAGLLDQNPEMTEAEASRIMDDIGLFRAFELCGEAFGKAFPASTGGPLAAGKRQNGTGRRS
jgi:hypothetical protein